MKNLLRVVLLSFLCGTIWGMVLNERQHRREEADKVRKFLTDPEVIALNEEWEKQNRVRGWLKDAEEGEGDDDDEDDDNKKP
jgi:hypothetical protein